MRRWLSLQRDVGLQMLALYLLLIIPVLLGLLVVSRVIGSRIRQNVEANDLSLARTIAEQTEVSIGNSLKAVQELATYPDVVNATPAGMERLFGVILSIRPDVGVVSRLDADGTVLFRFPTDPGKVVGADYSNLGYFQTALARREPFISGGRIAEATGQPVATAVMPIWSPDDAFLGIVGANIKLQSLSQTVTSSVSDDQSLEGLQVLILDSRDRIIANPDSALILHPSSEVLAGSFHASAGEAEGSQILLDPRGQERLYTLAAIPGIDWKVIVSRPTSIAFATEIMLQRATAVTAGLFALIGLLFWAILSSHVIYPIEQLATASKAIGIDPSIVDRERRHLSRWSSRPDQIGQLIGNFLRMHQSIAERVRGAATLLETSTAVVSTLDLTVVLDRILEQMSRLLVVERCAIIALDEQRGVFRVRASRGLSKSYVERLSIQPGEPDSVAMRALHAREAISITDTESDPSYVRRRHLSRSEGYRAILAVPLNTQHAPPTVLLIFHGTPHEFSSAEVQLLSTLANQATMAIENAVLFERSDTKLEQQTRRLEALIQSMDDGLILSDLKSRVVYANRRIAELASLSAEELTGVPVTSVLEAIAGRTRAAGKVLPQLAAVMDSRDGRLHEVGLDRPEGTVYLRLERFEVTDAREIAIGNGLILHDVTMDRELDTIKSNLISTVSHELRTPLAAIKGYASTLLAEDVEWDRSAQREFLTVISEETDRLTTLVNNLLDLSRLEAGALKLATKQCNIEEIVERAARLALLGPGNSLEVRIDADLPPLFADPPRLETILRNLLENAAKYAGAEAAIVVEASQRDEAVLFRVSDDGPGIPPEQRTRIFDSFYRVDNSLTRVASGAGLGLAICQGLVRAHGGHIWVESATAGTSIAFTIPLRAAPIHQEEVLR
jgi:PAS domain S-box-containing protein